MPISENILNKSDGSFQYNTIGERDVDSLTNWENEPNLIVLREDLNNALITQQKFISKIDEWKRIKDIEGKSKPPKEKNKSQYQPKTARKHLEWRYPTLSEPFLEVEEMFSINPATFEDMKSARQNELLLNYQFNNKIDKVSFIDEYVRRNVDEGICIVKTFWERIIKKEKQQVPVFVYTKVQDQQQFDLLNQNINLQQTNPNEFKNLSEEEQESVRYSLEQQVPAIATINRRVDKWVEKLVKNQPRLEIIDPRNCYIDPSCGSDYSKANFIIISHETSFSELKADGRYKNLDKVNFSNSGIDSDLTHVSKTPMDFNFSDKPRKRVIAYEYWGYYDINNTGELVPIISSWVGDTIIRLEENPFPTGKLPFIFSRYIPVLGEVYGESDISLLEDSQSIIGAISRGVIDLMAKTASNQRGIKKGFLDPNNLQRFKDGMDYEFNQTDIPQNAIYQHNYPDIPQSIFLLLQQQQLEAESLTGIKAFNGGMNGDQFGKMATGVRGLLSAASQRESAILRRLIKGVTDIGKNICMMNAEFLSEEEVIRITNKQFEKIRKEDLGGNYDIKVNISNPETSERTASDLAFLLQTLGPSVPFDVTKLVLSYIAKLKNLPELEEAINNINTEPSEEDKQLKQMEIEKLKLELDKLRSEIKVNEAKALEHEAKGQKGIIDNEQEATGINHERELEKNQAQAQGNQNLEITKAIINSENNISNDKILSAIGFNELSKNKKV